MNKSLHVPSTEDFNIDGQGSAPNWETAAWQVMERVGNGVLNYHTRFKVLGGKKGLYFLVECEDEILSCEQRNDFDNLFKEDVVEVFLWPNEGQPLYFEYEISPLNAELPILVPNQQGKFMGWRPWHYEGDRVISHATSVRGGPKVPRARVKGWSAEFRIPYALFKGLGNVPPASGSSWRANVYRIDYDAEKLSQWAWNPACGTDFHDFNKFGTFQFPTES